MMNDNNYNLHFHMFMNRAFILNAPSATGNQISETQNLTPETRYPKPEIHAIIQYNKWRST